MAEYAVGQPVFVVWVTGIKGPELQIWTDLDSVNDLGLEKWRKMYILATKKIPYDEIKNRPSLDELAQRYTLESLLRK